MVSRSAVCRKLTNKGVVLSLDIQIYQQAVFDVGKEAFNWALMILKYFLTKKYKIISDYSGLTFWYVIFHYFRTKGIFINIEKSVFQIFLFVANFLQILLYKHGIP